MRHRITQSENCEAVERFERDILTPLRASPDRDAEQLKRMYARMRLIREFDTVVKDLWQQDFIYGLAHSYVCAEAIAVGACAALREGDYITSTHRGHGHTIAKGGEPRRMMAELIDACEKGLCHDNEPFQYQFKYIDRKTDVGFFSRKREINYNSSYSVNG